MILMSGSFSLSLGPIGLDGPKGEPVSKTFAIITKYWNAKQSKFYISLKHTSYSIRTTHIYKCI